MQYITPWQLNKKKSCILTFLGGSDIVVTVADLRNQLVDLEARRDDESEAAQQKITDLQGKLHQRDEMMNKLKTEWEGINCFSEYILVQILQIINL